MSKDFWEGYVPEPVKPAPVRGMDKTIAMAREAGLSAFKYPELISKGDWENLDRFVALVRADEREETNRRANASWSLMCEKMVAAEREACAKVCETYNKRQCYNDEDMAVAKECAAAIRNRGNT